ncbi:MAG: cytochrome c oxidase subunit 3 family protein [Sandaracinus sp.]|nr:cytochrome c oxidase subunit 3 family protein [Myxococcales bacterium]MCB9612538.1 cytochrome c oxidase subunit 3 family protein [Sandaracinus sp.]MCB9633011.1 cytochrome c oxidase subunit 3 family protein [Sandaracinus sp.]
MASDHAHHGPAYLAHHFETPAQQFDAAKLGMWAFLAQEILFFSGLFVAYGIFRTWHPEAFSVGSHLLDWKMGGINTMVLLFSSFTAVMAVQRAQLGDKKGTSLFLLVTIACAFGFMIVKYFEYSHKIHVGILPGKYFGCPGFDCTAAPPEEFYAEVEHAISSAYANAGPGLVPYHIRTFYGIYFVMTGLHGIHVLVGIGIILWIWKRNQRGEFSKDFNTPVDLVALYWHLVDLIWIYLFPLLYLID